MGPAAARRSPLKPDSPPPPAPRVSKVEAGGAGVLLALALPPFGEALPGLGLLLGSAGLVFLARSVLFQPTPHAAAAAGALATGLYSLVALHWVPAAAMPYGNGATAMAAGLGVWGLHAATGLVVFGLVHRSIWRGQGADSVPAVRAILLLAAGWTAFEWLPSALPVVGVPVPPLALTLVEGAGPLGHLVSGWGGHGLAGAWAGLAAGVFLLLRHAWRPTPDRPESPSSRERSRGGAGGRFAGTAGTTVGVAVLVVLPTLFLAPGADAPAEDGGQGHDARAFLVEPDAHGPVEVTLAGWQRPPETVGHPERVAGEVEGLLSRLDPSGADGDVIVSRPLLWPEAPTGARPEDLRSDWLDAVSRTSPDPLAGTLWRDADGRLTNVLARRGGEVVHTKRHLMPGVERIRLRQAGSEVGRGLAPGARATPFEWAGRRVGGIICFEVLFSGQVLRLRRLGTDFIVQSTNDSMLQGGLGMPVVADAAHRQHMATIRLRAMEARVPVVRSAISGRSGGWGPDGHSLPVLDRVVVEGKGAGDPPLELVTVRVPMAGPAPVAVWLGPLAGPLSLGALLLSLVLGRAARPRVF